MDEAKRLNELMAENAQFKKLVANLSLKELALEEMLSKKGDARPKAKRRGSSAKRGVGWATEASLAASSVSLLGLNRQSARFNTLKPAQDEPYLEQIQRLVQTHPRYGYRRLHALVCRSRGTPLNIKRVHPLWKQAAPQVPPSQKGKNAPQQAGAKDAATGAVSGPRLEL
jgi:hypothetical protein